jgi:hypothetical protein
MIFCTQIYRKTDPTVFHPVVVTIDDIKCSFEQSTGSAAEMFQLRIKVQTDTNQDGTPDVADNPLSYWDIEKIFYATTPQLSIIDDRLRGTGNLMAGIRTFCKAQVDSHNLAVNPGGSTASHIDIDTDS